MDLSNLDFDGLEKLRDGEKKLSANVGAFGGSLSISIWDDNKRGGGPVVKLRMNRSVKSFFIVLLERTIKLAPGSSISMVFHEAKREGDKLKNVPVATVTGGRNDRGVCYIKIDAENGVSGTFPLRPPLSVDVSGFLDQGEASVVAVHGFISFLRYDAAVAQLLTNQKRDFKGGSGGGSGGNGGGSYGGRSGGDEGGFGGRGSVF